MAIFGGLPPFLHRSTLLIPIILIIPKPLNFPMKAAAPTFQKGPHPPPTLIFFLIGGNFFLKVPNVAKIKKILLIF